MVRSSACISEVEIGEEHSPLLSVFEVYPNIHIIKIDVCKLSIESSIGWSGETGKMKITIYNIKRESLLVVNDFFVVKENLIPIL